MFHFGHEVFFEVASQLSFSKAADNLFISQPAVSKHIKLLEEQYQLSLFERKGNIIALTEEGNLLLEYVKKVKELERQLDFEITASVIRKKQEVP